jgi:hypothetical protein
LRPANVVRATPVSARSDKIRLRRAPFQNPFSPAREKIALEFPTFGFFKTWVLRTPPVPKHRATRCRIPHRKRSHFPRISVRAPLFPEFVFGQKPPEIGATLETDPSRNAIAGFAQQTGVY